MKKLIKNVVSLDMTKATTESVKGLTISNAVHVVVTPTTRPLVGQIEFGNLVKLLEIPDGAFLSRVNGNMMVDGTTHVAKEAYMLVNGNVVVKNDVSPEALHNFFAVGADVNGDILLPDTIAAQFHQLKITLNGSVRTYPADSLLYPPTIKINNGFLSGLPSASKITVIPGEDLFIAADTDPVALERHISEIMVFGGVVVPENLANIFYKIASQYGSVTVIPEGYTFHSKALHITPSNILGLKGKSLYTRKNIVFKDGLDKQRIQQMDFRLIIEGNAILPESIADNLLDKIKAANIYTYRGRLITVSDEMKLSKSEMTEMTSYLVNSGAELSLGEDVSAADIMQGIGEIILFGFLMLREKHVRPISDKIIIKKGHVEILSAETNEEGDLKDEKGRDEAEYDIVIGNAVEYTL